MTRTTTTLRAPLVLFFWLVVVWLPGCFGCTPGIDGRPARRHAARTADYSLGNAPVAATAAAAASVRRSRRHRTSVVACMNHCTPGGVAALARPFWPGRGQGSAQPRRSPPALWTLACAAGVVAVASAKSAVSRLVLASDDGEQDGGGAAVDKVGAAMISFIKAYKKELSPLIPPACRFLPTCSVYGVQAIEKFGPTKGAVLTAWRLMRCNPFAGYGIDHPQWPPPGWFAGERW
ncbi:unnamed protein product [Ectocarpus sp. 13 AM-2016]